MAISLSRNIFSNHFPNVTCWRQEGAIPKEIKNNLESSISAKTPWRGFLSTFIADTVLCILVAVWLQKNAQIH